MYDATLLLEMLEQIDEALARIERRFAGINLPDDFLDSDKRLDMLPKNGEPFRQDHMHPARST
jgi:hypothetical protein